MLSKDQQDSLKYRISGFSLRTILIDAASACGDTGLGFVRKNVADIINNNLHVLKVWTDSQSEIADSIYVPQLQQYSTDAIEAIRNPKLQ